jgi:hypothetical protein
MVWGRKSLKEKEHGDRKRKLGVDPKVSSLTILLPEKPLRNPHFICLTAIFSSPPCLTHVCRLYN